MSLLGDLFSVAAPIVGGLLFGPGGAMIGGGLGGVAQGGGVQGFLKGAVGGYVGNFLPSVIGDVGGYLSGLAGGMGANTAEGAYLSSFAGGDFGGMPSFYSGFEPNFMGPPDLSGGFMGPPSDLAPNFIGPPAGFAGSGMDMGRIVQPNFGGDLPYSTDGGASGYTGGNLGYGGNQVSSFLSRLANFKSGGLGVPAMRTIAGINSIVESERLKRMMRLPNPQDITGMPGYQAGLEAVQRSMAAQGYQGSGNMMAALAKYGGDFYNQYAQQRLQSAQAQAGPVMGTTGGLALLAQGLGGFGG